ncbi:Transcriptional regulatory protein ZraR [Enhygromyxa salina]|uniref:Transcriptional regulatory protein ZraR n=2 Tax=Enhygromyxa salina TaxID=215803 RepID=A0A2S9YTT1_9BACT|nr:Transcriptional regulatory protein ZraR [Enhygromyxa salina]
MCHGRVRVNPGIDESFIDLVTSSPPMRTLLTWSDRGRDGPAPDHQGQRPRSDRGPLMRLLEHGEGWDRVVVLCLEDGGRAAAGLVRELRELDHAPAVELRILELDDPSDHAQLFTVLGPTVAQFRGDSGSLDVCLSAGTPQMQTMWVILVAAGLLRARMLQVIPAVFVPDPHPHPIRVVRLDIEGFPEIRAMREELGRLRAESRARSGSLVGESESMRVFLRRLTHVARADVPVLITGETGTGKELVARAIHAASDRARGPLVAENCGSFSEGVLASELFGHEQGAFSGAARRHRGLFEQADGGTLFLDEIAETNPRVQVMLLRVLQEGRLRRVGGESEIAVDVRVIAATHRDVPAMVERQQFREDLWYRLRGATLELPPLRERGRDLELLVGHFVAETQGDGGERAWPTAQAWAALRAYRWPGNVRELRAEIVRWRVFYPDEDTISLDMLSPEIAAALGHTANVQQPETVQAPGVDEPPRPLLEQLGVVEARALQAALSWSSGNLSKAARALEIDRNTLKAKLARHGLR